jgi:hypothetical protein
MRMTAANWNSVLSQLAAMAALAPSSHNCQPWRVLGLARADFEAEMEPAPPVGGDWSHALVVSIDRSVALRALPSLEREMRMSVGGFASLLLNLLRLSGFEAWPRILAPRWQPATARGRQRLAAAEPVLVLHVAVSADGVQPLTHPLARWIAERHTARGPYVPAPQQPPAAGCLPHRLAPADGFAWHHVPRGALFDSLGDFYRRHSVQDFRHGAAWRETYRHLEFSGVPGAGGGTGIDIQSLFGPLPAWKRRMYQAVLHPVVLGIAGPLGMHARIGRDVEGLVRSSAGLVYLCGPDADGDERRAHLLAGECVTDYWLSATRDGQGLHPLSVALQHPHIEAELRALLGCSRPVLFIARIGTPAHGTAPGSRRRRAPQAFCSLDFTAPQATS